MKKSTKEYFAAARQAMHGNRIRLMLLTLVSYVAYFAVYYGLNYLSSELILFFLYSGNSFVYQHITIMAFAVSIGITLVFGLFSIYQSLGMTQVILRPFEGGKPRLSDLLAGFRTPLKTLSNGLLMTFRCGIALLLCVLPVLVAILASSAMNVSGTPLTILMIALSIAVLCVYFAYMMGYCNVQLLQLLHPDMKVLELHRRSRAMMKKQRRRLLKLYLRMAPHILVQIIALVLLLVLIGATLYFVFPDLAPSDGRLKLNEAGITLLSVPLIVYLLSVNAAFIVELDKSLNPPAEPHETDESDEPIGLPAKTSESNETVESPAETGDTPFPAVPAEDSISPEE